MLYFFCLLTHLTHSLITQTSRHPLVNYKQRTMITLTQRQQVAPMTSKNPQTKSLQKERFLKMILPLHHFLEGKKLIFLNVAATVFTHFASSFSSGSDFLDPVAGKNCSFWNSRNTPPCAFSFRLCSFDSLPTRIPCISCG